MEFDRCAIKNIYLLTYSEETSINSWAYFQSSICW